ncbi:hypothetical protein EG329_002858 [Mollisiaceae sp. DMI_Dod_QoI]|nr:hypothetical protein EG329_002858 [Helotiales sp. DMI_Dod_QoI]
MPQRRSEFEWECCQCGRKAISRHEGGYHEYCLGHPDNPHRRCGRCTLYDGVKGHRDPVMFANGTDYNDLNKKHKPWYEGPGGPGSFQRY